MDIPGAMRGGLAAAVRALACCTTTLAVADGQWTAHCAGVPPDDCRRVAELFVNNLAWSGGWIREETGGNVFVTPMPVCPLLPDWAEPGACWRAYAPTRTDRACMVVARQSDSTAMMPFGQAGGDNYTGLMGAPKPGTTPC